MTANADMVRQIERVIAQLEELLPRVTIETARQPIAAAIGQLRRALQLLCAEIEDG